MKLARVQDYSRWLRSQADKWPFQPERILFEDVPTLGTGEIVLSSPVTLLAGPNGVGKTTLLKAIWATLAPGLVELDGPTGLKLSSGRITIDYRLNAEHQTKTASFTLGDVVTDGEFKVEVVHLDAASAVQEHQKEFCAFTDLDDIINGVGPRILDIAALLEVNYVTRRDYREVRIYEVEATSGVVPFFEVSYGNDRYDSRTMGAGELAALFLWWSVDRPENNTIFLMEEPETYLSPACQEAICYYIIASAFEKKHCFIVTSHSAKVIAAIPETGHSFLFRSGGAIKVIEGTPPPAILGTIGVSIAVDTVLLVEDEAAAILLRQILEKYNSGLSRRSEIKICDGHGGISGILKKVGGQLINVGVFGVFDGDAKGEVEDKIRQHSVFLPGEMPVEVAFRRMVEADNEALRAATGSDHIPAILFGIQGADHHDWYADLCKHLGMTKAQVLPLLFRLWIRSDDNAVASQALVAELDKVTAKAH